MENKKGISMSVLVIIVVVLLILTSTITISIGNSIADAKLVEFAENIQKVSEASVEYYMNNSSYALKENISYSFDDIKSKLVENKKLSFEEEVTKNNDVDSVFYYLDISKLNLQNMKTGYQKLGSEEEKQTDIYMISYPTENVYYLKGIKVDGKYYFSLVNISGNQKLNQKLEEKFNVLGISYKKEKRGYTNKLGITINAYMNLNESLYIASNGNNESLITTKIGDNVIGLDTPFSAISNNNSYDIDAATNTSPDYISVIKKDNNNNLIGSVNILVKNFDNKKPLIDTSKIEKTYNEEYNVFKFFASDDKSGIRQIKYEYAKSYDEMSIEKNYYDNEVVINQEYMQNFAKVERINAKSGDGAISIKVPRNVSQIYFCVVDGAGNYSNIYSSGLYDASSGYVGAYFDANTTQDTYIINLSTNNTSVINSFDVSISKDGSSYGNVNNISSSYLTKEGNVTRGSISFSSLKSDNVYVKTTVNVQNGKSYTVVNKLEVKGSKYATVTKKITDDKLSITIPVGFAPVILNSDGSVKSILGKDKWNNKTFTDSVINQGVVVVDELGNEYVWIPVGSDIEYSKRNSDYNDSNTVTVEEVTDDSLPNGITSETYQIEKYGGFYVARYEAGLPDSQTTEELMATKTFSAADNNRTDIGKAQSKANKIVWNRIDYNNAKTVAEDVISNSYVQTGLLTGTQWDTMCKFIEKDGVNVLLNSSNWGNYKNMKNYTVNDVYYKTQDADVVYKKGSYTKSADVYLLLPTGIFARAVEGSNPKNICDVAGNAWELTAEKVNEVKNGQPYIKVGNVLLRGGYGNCFGNYCATCRYGLVEATYTHPSVGFRFVLYIK